MMILVHKKPPLKDVLTVCFFTGFVSEAIKVLSCIEMVPSSDGSIIYPYLQMQYLPLHLCSIQLFTISYCRFGRGKIEENHFKRFLLAFMYPTCTLGALFAIVLPSIFSTTITPAQAFTHPIAYQVFIYHSMLVSLGLYIPMSGEVRFSWSTYRSTMVCMSVLALAGLYINSMMASPSYVNGKLVSVDYVTNFLFLYRTPVGIELNSKPAWFAYLLILTAIVFVLIALMYLPLRRTPIWDADKGHYNH